MPSTVSSRRGVELAPDHRRHPQALHHRPSETLEAPGDELLHVVGQPDARQLVGARRCAAHAGVGEVADHLLDEERIALGLGVERARRTPREGVRQRAQAHEPAASSLGQAAELELRAQPRRRAAPPARPRSPRSALAGPVGAEDPQPPTPAGRAPGGAASIRVGRSAHCRSSSTSSTGVARRDLRQQRRRPPRTAGSARSRSRPARAGGRARAAGGAARGSGARARGRACAGDRSQLRRRSV